MTTVYAIASGSYSDYRINGIYSTHALAQAAIDLMNRPEMYFDDARIEEYELDTAVDHYARGEVFCAIVMFRDGSTPTASLSMWGEEATKLCWNYDKSAKYLIVQRWAIDAESVIKIANEIRAQMIASGEWA